MENADPPNNKSQFATVFFGQNNACGITIISVEQTAGGGGGGIGNG